MLNILKNGNKYLRLKKICNGLNFKFYSVKYPNDSSIPRTKPNPAYRKDSSIPRTMPHPPYKNANNKFNSNNLYNDRMNNNRSKNLKGVGRDENVGPPNVYKYKSTKEIRKFYYQFYELLTVKENVNILINVYDNYFKVAVKIENTSFEELAAIKLIIDIQNLINKAVEYIDNKSISKVLCLFSNQKNITPFSDFIFELIKIYDFKSFFNNLTRPYGHMISDLFLNLCKLQGKIYDIKIEKRFYFFRVNLFNQQVFLKIKDLKYGDQDTIDFLWVMGKNKLRQIDFAMNFIIKFQEIQQYLPLKLRIIGIESISKLNIFTENLMSNFITQLNKDYSSSNDGSNFEIELKKERESLYFFNLVSSLGNLANTKGLLSLDDKIKTKIFLIYDRIFSVRKNEKMNIKSRPDEFYYDLIRCVRFFIKIGDFQRVKTVISEFIDIEVKLKENIHLEIILLYQEFLGIVDNDIKISYEILFLNSLNHFNKYRDKINPKEYLTIVSHLFNNYLSLRLIHKKDFIIKNTIAEFILTLLNEIFIRNVIKYDFLTIELLQILNFIKLSLIDTDDNLFHRIIQVGNSEIENYLTTEKEKLTTEKEKISVEPVELASASNIGSDSSSQFFNLYLICTSINFPVENIYVIKPCNSKGSDINKDEPALSLIHKILYNQIKLQLNMNINSIEKSDLKNNIQRHFILTAKLANLIKSLNSNLSITTNKIYEKIVLFDIYIEKLGIAFIIDCFSGFSEFRPKLTEEITNNLLLNSNLSLLYNSQINFIKSKSNIKVYFIPDYLIQFHLDSEVNIINEKSLKNFLNKIIII